MTDSSFSPGAVEGAVPGAATRLRDAAAKLRETAEGATPGQWKLLTYQIVATYDDAGENVTEVAYTSGHTPNACWIALAHPGLAEPLAAWLEAAAAEYLTPDWTDCPTAEAALAVARAITGGAQ